MDWIVAASPDETAGGALSPETENAAHAALREHGCILLRGAFPPAIVEAMHREYLSQLGMLDLAAMKEQAERPPPNRLIGVGRARYDIALRMTGVFGKTEVFANPLLMQFLRPLLGKDMRLNSFTVVVSHPGSPRQHAHRDNDHLFSEPGVGPGLPVYAVNVAVPLIDVDLQTGPTGVWLGSHRSGQVISVQNQEMKASPLRRGDCMLLDYRTLHAGMPNLGTQPRPILYLVYARRWFFDDVNYVNRLPLDMPLERFDQLPEQVRPLMVRAYSCALHTRVPEVATNGRAAPRPAPAEPPKPGKVGRNDACPCGSGKKYKHCHGRMG
jgi:Phytanoyl-CoA dioxygenase (PhyH)/SEC-C motif